jgi:hypothetical protein
VLNSEEMRHCCDVTLLYSSARYALKYFPKVIAALKLIHNTKAIQCSVTLVAYSAGNLNFAHEYLATRHRLRLSVSHASAKVL